MERESNRAHSIAAKTNIVSAVKTFDVQKPFYRPKKFESSNCKTGKFNFGKILFKYMCTHTQDADVYFFYKYTTHI